MPRLSASVLRRRARALKVVLMDVDGVLSDGRLYHFVDAAGELVELKGVHSHDSIALTWLCAAGLKTGLISGRISKGMERRAKMLGMTHVYQHRLDKKNVFDEICRKEGIRPREALFIGDDLPDLPVLRAAGIGVAVSDARPEVKAAAGWVTKARGGRGAVREVAEFVLAARGRWKGVLAKFD